MKLWEYIKAKMLEHPSQLVREGNTQLTYMELISQAEKLANKLQDKKCCAILCEQEMATSIALLACFAAGTTAVPLSMRYGEQHCNKILGKISPNVIVKDQSGNLEVTMLNNSEYCEPVIPPALIMCTSGTTGSPKGAMLTEDNIIANLEDIGKYFDINAQDHILIVRPLYHCASLTGEFLTGLTKGCRISFYSKVFNPPIIPGTIQKLGITTLCGTPTLIDLISHFAKNESVSSIKNLCIGGECMSAETGIRIAKAFPQAKIYHVYGLTEACPRVSFLPPSLFLEYPDYVGIPLNSVEIKILRSDGTKAKTNEDGVLFVKGKNIMIGYYNDPDNTKSVLNNGWLCTKDVALINGAGLLKIKGRYDNMIIKCGMNIYPIEIEAALKTDPSVKEALAYGYYTRFGEQIGLKIAGDFNSVEQIKEICSKYLPSYQMPSKIEIVDALPKNGTGKIIRKI